MEEKNQRHIKEMERDIEGWKNELDYAKTKFDVLYEDYCVMMIKICEDTIKHLNSFASERFI